MTFRKPSTTISILHVHILFISFFHPPVLVYYSYVLVFSKKKSHPLNIIPWFAGLLGQMTRQPSIWCSKYYFLILSFRLKVLKTLYFYFCKFIKKIEKQIEMILAKNFARYCEKKNNTWNIRCLVDDSFVPANQCIIF